jgi:hypothetical protein
MTGKSASPRTGIDRFLQYLADQFGPANPLTRVFDEFQRIGQVLQRMFDRNARSGNLAGTVAFRP